MTQDTKPMHVQALEILRHIQDRDYGIAETKAAALHAQLHEGGWTLGAGGEEPASFEQSMEYRIANLEKSITEGDYSMLRIEWFRGQKSGFEYALALYKEGRGL